MPYDEALADRVRIALRSHPDVAEKKMFGGLAFLYRGQMCCGIVKSDLMLRLGKSGVKAALQEPGARPMDFTGKPMSTMIYVEAASLDREEDLGRWIARALSFAKEENGWHD